jgi:uroporphyrinogen-III synthase
MRRLLVLRPEPGATVTVKRARDRGLDAAAVPLFEVEPLGWKAPDPSPYDGLLLTSANAIRHGGEELAKLRGLPAYCVGEATAEAAREARFNIVATGDRGVDQLLGSIEPGLKLLHLCGEDRREPANAGSITAIPVYRAKELEHPDLSLARGTVALIPSPRAGRRFAELISDRGSIAIVAISPAAAESAGTGWKVVETAAEPNDDALLALAARLCNNPPPK